jgi:hypothetical protein
LAQSIWWISSIIGLQQRLVIHLDNLEKRIELQDLKALSRNTSLLDQIAPTRQDRQGLTVPRDLQEDRRIAITTNYGHPDTLPQIGITTAGNSREESSNRESERASIVARTCKEFIQKSRKERKGFNKMKKNDQLSRMRSGKVIVNPLTKGQRSYLQCIPQDMIGDYLNNRQ